MMKIKKVINFTDLRSQGPSVLDIKDDEVVQMVSKGKEIKCIITQEYLLKLETAYHAILVQAGLRKEEIVDASKFDRKEFEKHLSEVVKKAQEE